VSDQTHGMMNPWDDGGSRTAVSDQTVRSTHGGSWLLWFNLVHPGPHGCPIEPSAACLQNTLGALKAASKGRGF
jgi:hypothetical protein